MTQPVTGCLGPERRLHGMMQFLMTQAATGNIPEPAPSRDVVTLDAALDAVLQLSAVIDLAMQEGRLPRPTGEHAAGMLMLLRDYIKPLPVGPIDDGRDGVADDLAELVKALRETGGEIGVQG
jgi:hypothetical protein